MYYFLAFIVVSTVFKLLKHRFSTEIIEIEKEETIEPYWDFKTNQPVGIELNLFKEEQPQQSELDEQTQTFYTDLASEIQKDLLSAEHPVDDIVIEKHDYESLEADTYYNNLYSHIPEEEPYLDDVGSKEEQTKIENNMVKQTQDSEIIELTGQVIGREEHFVHFFANERASRCWINTEGEILPHDKELFVIVEKQGDSTILLHWEEL